MSGTFVFVVRISGPIDENEIDMQIESARLELELRLKDQFSASKVVRVAQFAGDAGRMLFPLFLVETTKDAIIEWVEEVMERGAAIPLTDSVAIVAIEAVEYTEEEVTPDTFRDQLEESIQADI